MNKREQKKWHRVCMKRALRKAGVTLTGNEPTEFLEEMVALAYKPSIQPFDQVVTRAKVAME